MKNCYLCGEKLERFDDGTPQPFVILDKGSNLFNWVCEECYWKEQKADETIEI